MKKVFVFKLDDEGAYKVEEFNTQIDADKFISEQEVPPDYYSVVFDV